MSRIPKHAKKVFEGTIFDVYQWEQKMFDGSTAIFEGIRRPDTVQIIPVLENGNIVIAHEMQPDMNAPLDTLFGGRMEKKEEPLEAAKRELLEESGFSSEDWELYMEYDAGGSPKIEWHVHVFVARNAKKVQEPELEPGEKIESREVDFDGFIETVLSENFWSHNFKEHIRKMKLENNLDTFKQKLLNERRT